jgi:predicted ester cyclase
MKSIVFFFSIVIVLFLSATLQAQITNIEVGGKKVKISKWKGIETKHISGELVLQIKSKKDEVKIKEKINRHGFH